MSDDADDNSPLERAGRPAGSRIQAAPKQRASAEAREPARSEGQRLTRQRTRHDDAFYIDPRIIPPGISYEWKRKSVYGKPDGRHQINLSQNHWTPVPAERHPHLVPDLINGAIEQDGMVLMQRPQYLTDDARQEDFEIAMAEVHKKEASVQGGATPDGTFTRDHPSVQRVTKINHSYEPLQVPKE